MPEESGELGEGYDEIVQNVRHGIVRGYQRTLAESIKGVSQHVRIIRLKNLKVIMIFILADRI